MAPTSLVTTLRRGALLVFSLALAASGGSLLAQDQPYRLGVGDELGILVVGEEEYSVRDPGIRIGPDGRVGLPGVGAVAAEGRTVEEVQADIKAALTGPIRDPLVTVWVTSYNSQMVNVLGAVKTPGGYPHRPGMTVLDAIALGGGLVLEDETQSSASMRARLIRQDKTIIAISLREAMAGMGEAARLDLQPGDTLLVEQVSAVSVLGYVATPGHFEVQDGCRLTEALARAGGATDDSADLRTVTVTHADGTAEQVDAKAALEGDPEADVQLLPGDVVYVPRSERDASVMGYVRSPGRFQFYEGDRVSDLLARSGGEVLQVGAIEGARGDLTQVLLSRTDGAMMTLDMAKVMQGDPEAPDPEVLPGDIVLVPEERVEVAVFGHVVSPGRYRLRPGDRVLDLLATAGGPLRPREVATQLTSADLANCTLQRSTGETLTLDLSELEYSPERMGPDRAGGVGRDGRVDRGAGGANAELQPLDTLYVPEAHNRVLVTGYVTQAGYFEYRPGETVRAALGMAGGIVNNVGSAQVVLRHVNGQEETLDTVAHDVPLTPGIEVRVPFLRSRVAVLGYVNLPGFFEYHEGDRVVDMISQAGGIQGLTPTRNYQSVKGEYYRAFLFRVVGGEGVRYDLDLKGFYESGDPTSNMEVQADDVIMVPGKEKFDTSVFIKDLMTLPSLYLGDFSASDAGATAAP